MALKGKPITIGTAATTIYTCPAGVESAVHGLIFSNNTISPLVVTVQLFNQADNNTTTVATNLSVPANSFITWTKPVNMNAGDVISASANASGIVCLFSVYEGGAAPVAIGFTGRGTWNNGSSYSTNDIATVTGIGTYLALQPSVNQDPATATAFWMFLEGISASALPVQTSQTGKFLTTDGTDASWAEIDTTNLKTTFPVATGQSVTQLKAVSLNDAGEVGAYPVVNTLGTVREDNVSEKFYDGVSRDGSRAVRYVTTTDNTTNWTITLTGAAITNSAAPVIGATTVTSNVSLSGGTDTAVDSRNVFILPLVGNQNSFIVFHFRSLCTVIGGQYNDRARANVFILSVDASGNLTKHSEAQFNLASVSNSITNAQRLFTRTSLNTDTFIGGYRFGNGSRDMRYISVSGTTITTTNVSTDNTSLFSIASGFSFANQTRSGFIVSNTKFIQLNWNTLRIADVSGGQIAGSFTTNTIQTDLSSSGNAFTALLTENRGFVVYRRNDSKMWLQTIEWNNIGVPTIVSERVLKEDASVFQFSNMDCHVKSATEFLITFRNGPVSSSLSVLLNSDGTINSTNAVGLPQDSAGQQVRLNDPATNKFFYVYSQTISGITKPRMVPINVNAYGTIKFNYLGFPVVSSSGPTANIILSGVVSGFTGLAIGAAHYVDLNVSDGTITTVEADNPKVGVAVSGTELLI